MIAAMNEPDDMTGGALQESDERLRQTLACSPVAIVILTPSGDIVSANPPAERMLGLSAKDMVTRTYKSPEWRITAVDGGPFPSENLAVARVIRTGEAVYGVAHAVEHPDGTRVLLSVNAAPVHDADGRLTGVVAVMDDITERERMIGEMRSSAERLRAVIDHAPFGAHMYELKPDGKLVFIGYNRKADEILGVDHAQFLGLTIEKAFPGLVGTATPEAYRTVAREGTTYEVDQQFYDAEGIAGVFEVHAFSFAPGRMAAFFHDVTEKRRLENAVRESEARYRTLFNSMLEGFAFCEMIYDDRGEPADWIYLSVNDAFPRITGLQDVVGKRVLEILPTIKDDSPELFAAYGRVAAGGPPEEFEFDFSTLDMWLRVSAFSPSAGQFVAVFEDITQRKRAQLELQQLNEELEHRVAQRTAELEASNRELQAFTYSVSHDLRAPLRHIGAFSELLDETCGEQLGEQGRHYLDVIKASSHKLGVLIDDLLQFSRAGRVELELGDVDMNALVAEAVDSLQHECAGRTIEWSIASLPMTYGDAALLRQVWVNLLSNAVKYTRPRDVAHIEVGFTDGPDRIEYFVRDDGVGLDMQYAHKLFGVFQRLHGSEDFEGTGVGLANVQRIVTRHGGRTRAEGAIDKGAPFTFSLPKRGAGVG